MSRVKRGVTARAAHKKIIKAAKGYLAGARTSSAPPCRRWRRPGNTPTATGARKKRNFRASVDPAHQCRDARARPHLWPIYRRARQGRYRDRPQSARRSRRARASGFRSARREGESRPLVALRLARLVRLGPGLAALPEPLRGPAFACRENESQ